jgi:hypothetical protein
MEQGRKIVALELAAAWRLGGAYMVEGADAEDVAQLAASVVTRAERSAFLAALSTWACGELIMLPQRPAGGRRRNTPAGGITTEYAQRGQNARAWASYHRRNTTDLPDDLRAEIIEMELLGDDAVTVERHLKGRLEDWDDARRAQAVAS